MKLRSRIFQKKDVLSFENNLKHNETSSTITEIKMINELTLEVK